MDLMKDYDFFVGVERESALLKRIWLFFVKQRGNIDMSRWMYYRIFDVEIYSVSQSSVRRDRNPAFVNYYDKNPTFNIRLAIVSPAGISPPLSRGRRSAFGPQVVVTKKTSRTILSYSSTLHLFGWPLLVGRLLRKTAAVGAFRFFFFFSEERN